MRYSGFVLVGLLAWATPGSAQGVHADLVLVGGKVWTENPRQPEAQALAVWRDRILAVGSDADIQKLAGPATQTIDLKGRRVLQGFFDMHVHMLAGGIKQSQVYLKDAADEAEFGKRLQEFDRKLPKNRWLLGGSWDHDRTFKGALPTAALIDKYVPDRPVFLNRYDGHQAVANTRALKLAGITAATADPAGGVIARLPNSQEPAGVLRNNALGLVSRLIPPPDDAEIAEAIQTALLEVRRNGITSLVDLDGNDAATRMKVFRLYQELARQGKLTCRIELRWPLADWLELARLGVENGFGDDWVKIGGVKGFIDGSLGSSTARFFEPYLHEPDSSGVFVTPPDTLRKLIQSADLAGLGVTVHAIGDRGNAELLDIFAAVIQANGPRDRRFRIEHAQHLRPQDYRRFAELGVIASMQPYHIIDDGRWAENRIGAKRCASSYANRGLLDAGVKVAFGSDWYVAPLSPLLGIDAAVHRRTLDGKHPTGWHPAQRISVKESLTAYTATAAYALYAEADRGTLAPGKLADLVVLSRDILADGEREQIGETTVELTLVGGRVVYRK